MKSVANFFACAVVTAGLAGFADYVHRIARGARPSELPIERPTIFESVINQRTAKALGLEFSQAMLLRADEVIE